MKKVIPVAAVVIELRSDFVCVRKRAPGRAAS